MATIIGKIRKVKKMANAKPTEPTVAEIKAKLDELGIEYDKKASKDVLLTLLPTEGE